MMAIRGSPSQVPTRPKIYHIVHIDRLPSIIDDGVLWCDAGAIQRTSPGSTIGMSTIKERRLTGLHLTSHPDLHVGDCVPFYFCPRSVVLYVIHMANHPELVYRGGQRPIVHLEADLYETVAWAEQTGVRWAFTTSNAGSGYFEDYADLAQLPLINWAAVDATRWQDPMIKEGKQAEFLVEQSFPWHLVERIGVHSPRIRAQADEAIDKSVAAAHTRRPRVEVVPGWYY